jgi:hypothetical protein
VHDQAKNTGFTPGTGPPTRQVAVVRVGGQILLVRSRRAT